MCSGANLRSKRRIRIGKASRVALVVGIWFAAAALPTRGAVAQPTNAPPSSPREWFGAGVAHFEAERFAEALDAFSEAYRLSPHPSVLVNIANCHVGLSEPVQAAQYFERYLREQGAELSPSQRREVMQALGQARLDIAQLRVQGPPGAGLFIDGTDAAQLPLSRPIETNPGERHLEVRNAQGQTLARQSVTLRAGQNPVVTFDAAAEPRETPADDQLARDGEPAPATTNGEPALLNDPPESADDASRRRLSPGVWMAGGVTVVALAMGVGFGAKALGQRRDFDELADLARMTDPAAEGYNALISNARSVHNTRRQNAIIADVALGIGLVGAAVTAFLAVRSLRRANAEEAAEDNPAEDDTEYEDDVLEEEPLTERIPAVVPSQALRLRVAPSFSSARGEQTLGLSVGGQF